MTEELIRQAISALKAGDKSRGKQLLIRVLDQNAKNELAWLWLAECVDNRAQKIDCFRRVLEINPDNIRVQEEIARLQTLEEIKGTPKPPATKNEKPKRRPLLAYILITAIFVVCICGSTLILLSNGSDQSIQQRPSGVRQIAGNTWFGCTDRDYFEQLIRFAVDQDKEALQHALTSGIISGICTVFNDGEFVYITDNAIFSGLTKVRRQGEVREFWTNIEAVR